MSKTEIKNLEKLAKIINEKLEFLKEKKGRS